MIRNLTGYDVRFLVFVLISFSNDMYKYMHGYDYVTLYRLWINDE